jgi:hypothetical protein
MSEPIEGRTGPAQLLLTLEELVDALDRRRPQLERAGEAQITAEANRLRASAMQRIALLRRSDASETVPEEAT